MFIRQLHYLVALARERHFGRAASACHVSQPALSGAVRRIEQELGVVVVQRSRRFEGFTPEGERVLAWARRVIADCEGLRQDAQAGVDDPVGVLRTGAIPASISLVPKLTQVCLLRYPRLRHEIRTLSASEILHRLERFEIDIGLSYMDDERLLAFKSLPLFRERYVLLARDRSMFEGLAEIGWREAARLPMCLFTTNMQCRQGIDRAFSEAGAPVEPRVESDSMTGLCAHVSNAGLYSILPHSALCLPAAGNMAWIPLVPVMSREIGLVVRPREPLGPLMEAALSGLQAFDLQGWVDAIAGIEGTRQPG